MCCGSANWKREEVPDHKFDFIDVRDFRNNGFFCQLKYTFLFLMVIKSFAVYVADIYTAITLLAFGHFSGSLYDKVQNDPDNNFRVPISYGRWIFTGCIIFSFLLLAYEAHKSRAIVRSRDISYAYTNVMANNYYSLRSYDHYCFFEQINDSKKKKDEVAFFIFFTFKGWKRLLVADGPRQIINFFTLYGLGSFAKWSTDPYDYYEGNIMTGIMILSMLFTVAVFAGSLILLIIAAVAYIPLLCYIKGNLKEYCCHKIDKRVTELVHRKKKERLAKVAEISRKEAAGDFSHLMNKKGEMVGRAMPQPTLPNVDVDLLSDEKPNANGAPLQRTNSVGSSTAVHSNGYYGNGPGNFYAQGGNFYNNHAPSTNSLGYNDQQAEYGSSAHLVVNAAGPAGHNDNVETLLDNMGPIGTSPMLFAQRMGGQGRGTPSPTPGYDPYSQTPQHGGQRALLDPNGNGMHASPGFGPQRYTPSPSPYDQDTASIHQSPFHQPHRIQGRPTESPFAAGGLDYPPPQNTHGVEGLEFPPPPPPDMSSYVPYGGHDNHGAFQPTIDVSAAPPTSMHHGGQSTLVGHGTDGFGGELHPDVYANGYANGARPDYSSSQHSPDPSVGGYEDLYDAYLHSRSHSPAVTADQRHSYMMSDYNDQGRQWSNQQTYGGP
ncbi:hypothetical protein BCV70DRAFT_14226 [Testicularia cyperi]|uniref:Vacuole protein n=1 Tax=Testicularia cyperi TaxID=1882483 RepID=A0A317Y131_9BASI|nr:hypothetical protein BCV70DRAFT_14226 [Testicularia cyperi]